MCHNESEIVHAGPIRVMIVRCLSGRCFAQALEVDYFSEGLSVEEAITNFVSGFRQTLELHKTQHGSFQKFLIPAPKNTWKEFYRFWFLGKWTQLEKTAAVPIVSTETEIQSKDILPFRTFVFLLTEDEQIHI